MTINIIDPHLHLFSRSRGHYYWLKSENPPFWPDKYLLQQDFSLEDLNNSLENEEIKLTGFVHIEAGFDNAQPWRELEYLNDLTIESLPCQKNRTIASIDLLAPPEHFQKSLQQSQQYQSLIGVRHILDEQAYTILSNHNVQENFVSLNKVSNFIFELQLPLADESSIKVMPLLLQTIDKNKQLRFIINHAGFPPVDISNDAFRLWEQNIQELAKRANIFIKCSGWEMVERQYDMSWFSEVTNFCLNTFSIERVMLASNFPLCLLGRELGRELGKELGRELGRELGKKVGRTPSKELDSKLGHKSYASYWQDILKSSVIKQCSNNEKNALLYDNAFRIYQLDNFES
jgi:L-fuconolactonase